MFSNFKRKTVDSVLGQFNTIIADLASIADEQSAIRDQKAAEAKEAMKASEAAEAEAGRAIAVASKIQALVS